jgi:hypothetical protein
VNLVVHRIGREAHGLRSEFHAARETDPA